MSTLFKGLEQIEAARENIKGLSFMAGLFLGRPDFNVLFPPSESAAERAEGEAFCRQVEAFLVAQVDADEIERSAIIPDHVLKGLLAMGAFGMKIPKEYGGLGFSHKNYGRVLTLIASWSNILSLTVVVPQSIGIAMPILLFGNERQKNTYLPLVARQEISAFALTEPVTGSDAANVQTTALLSSDGSHFVVSGEKLWCTNGPIARFITLIARVPAKRVVEQGKSRWQPVAQVSEATDHVHTAFILDMKTAGVTVQQRCQFEGCRGIANAHMTFAAVVIPAENIIGEVGSGLKYALSILNIGRAVSVPAICLGMAKQAWQPTLDRANTRYTFKQPLATRQTQQVRVGNMATNLFAMEALCERVWQMADQDNYDVRLESAITKMFCSEQSLQFLNDAQV
ncbi:MAG: putative acyl-CoA dehydrogenase, partial [Halothiobacillaceae bacterium]